MLNTNISQNTQVSAVTGTLVKSHLDSFFIICNLKHQTTRRLFDKYPSYEDTRVEVLQIMLVGNMEVIAEVVDSEHYNMKIK